MSVPYIFSTVPGGTTIPLEFLDANFLYLTGGTPGNPTVMGSIQLTGNLAVTGTTTVTGLTTLNGGLTLSGPFTINGITVSPTGTTGVGNLVFSNGPTLVAPILGTPASGNLANCTNYPISQIAGLASGVLPFLTNPSSANLALACTDETGSGNLVFSNNPLLNSPTFTTPVLGTPSSGNLSACTAYPATSLSGVVPVTGGGTGLPSTGSVGQVLAVTGVNSLGYINAPPAAGVAGGAASQILYQSAPNTTAFVPNGTNGQVLISAGAAPPTWGTLSLTGLTGVLPVGSGGTGLTSITAGCIPYGNGTGPLQYSGTLTYGASGLAVANSTNNSLFVITATAGSPRYINLQNQAESSNSYLYATGSAFGVVQSDANPSSTLYFSTQNIERARIDSSGNLMIGTTSSAGLLTVNGIGAINQVNTGSVHYSDGTVQTTAGTNLLSQSGYQKLPGGLIMQWGYIAATGGAFPVVLPIAYPNGIFIASATAVAADGKRSANILFGSITTSGFTVQTGEGSQGNQNLPAYWYSLGF